jgi:alpha-tubulin suppressor-like RCC1 family protein
MVSLDITANTSENNTPTNVTGSNSDLYTAITLGYYHACGITENGTLKCWGRNNSGQLGTGIGTGNTSTPLSIDDTSTYKSYLTP